MDFPLPIPVLTLLITFSGDQGPGAGVTGEPQGCKRAAQDLTGGPVSLLEGLAHSGGPCAQRLSVAGFLALLGRFLGWDGFILRGEEAPFGPERPPSFNPAAKSVKLYTRPAGSMVPSRSMYTQGGWRGTYLGCVGRHIHGVGRGGIYTREAYTTVLRVLRGLFLLFYHCS